MEHLYIPLSLAAGGLLNVQAGANAQLARATGSPFTATTLQLSVAAILLAAVAVVTGSLAAFAALPGARWWHVLGGVASAIYVVSTIFLFPRIGAVVSVGSLESVGWSALEAIAASSGGSCAPAAAPAPARAAAISTASTP